VMRVLIEAVPATRPAATARGRPSASSRRSGPSRRPLLVHGEDQWAWPVLRWAQQQGYDTRIGLEDTLFDEAGLRARSNAALVREAITGRREPDFGVLVRGPAKGWLHEIVPQAVLRPGGDERHRAAPLASSTTWPPSLRMPRCGWGSAPPTCSASAPTTPRASTSRT
jgi:hypothetical protein